MWIFILACIICEVSTEPDGEWYAFGENQYFYGNASLSWIDARDKCENALNSKLAVITTEDENNFLMQLIEPSSSWLYGVAWIGLRQGVSSCQCLTENEQCQLCRDSWIWYDGTPMNFHHWKAKEPNLGECGRITRTGWADYVCGQKFRYLCKRHLCDSIQCVQGHCSIHNRTATCHCNNGYTGLDCSSDIDECAPIIPCENGAICINTIGSYGCLCVEGWKGRNCSKKKNDQINSPRHDTSSKESLIGGVLGSVVGLLLLIILVFVVKTIRHKGENTTARDEKKVGKEEAEMKCRYDEKKENGAYAEIADFEAGYECSTKNAQYTNVGEYEVLEKK